jgi:hypothetical protein
MPLLALLMLASCTTKVFIAPYSPELDRGVQDFKLELNLLVNDAAAEAGKPEGAFEAFQKRYSELAVRIDLLADRARIEEVNDVDCSLSKKALEDFKQKFSTVAPAVAGTSGESKGCMTRLMENAKKQLLSVQGLHSKPENCAWPNAPTLTCIRVPLAKGALSAANQSLDAALFVQDVKRKDAQNEHQG